MSRTKALEKVKLTRFDDLFGSKEAEPAVEAGEVKQIPISELHEFHNHPFQIRSDEELEEMIESVRQHGVLVPGIVRPRKKAGNCSRRNHMDSGERKQGSHGQRHPQREGGRDAALHIAILWHTPEEPRQDEPHKRKCPP